MHNRTFNVDDKTKSPMVYTKDLKALSFKTFDACYSWYLNESRYNVSYNVDTVFKVDIEGGGASRILHKGSEKETLRDKTEMKMYDKLEKTFECSGMCEPGLFYFGKELHHGPPKHTCFLKFKDSLHSVAGTFAANLILCGVIALLATFAHFCLYARPKPPQEE